MFEFTPCMLTKILVLSGNRLARISMVKTSVISLGNQYLFPKMEISWLLGEPFLIIKMESRVVPVFLFWGRMEAGYRLARASVVNMTVTNQGNHCLSHRTGQLSPLDYCTTMGVTKKGAVGGPVVIGGM